MRSGDFNYSRVVEIQPIPWPPVLYLSDGWPLILSNILSLNLTNTIVCVNISDGNNCCHQMITQKPLMCQPLILNSLEEIMEFYERLKSLRIQNRLTQKELGDKLGVSVVSVRCWETGTKSPSLSAIVSIAETFNVSIDYLVGVKKNHTQDKCLLNSNESTLVSNYRSLDSYGRKAVYTLCQIEKERVVGGVSEQQTFNNEKPTNPQRFIPKYITPSAAGYSAPLDGEDFEMILVDESVPQDADFAVRIQGDSMAPYINDGDTVYVRRCDTIESGDVGIFCVDGSMYCKQYYKDADGNIKLISANRELSDSNVYIAANSNNSIVCCGKVIMQSITKVLDS